MRRPEDIVADVVADRNGCRRFLSAPSPWPNSVLVPTAPGWGLGWA